MKLFLQDRIRLVRELIESEINVAYGDLVLILSAVISSCAAARWPGRNKDRKRFVELLIRHSLPEAHADWVCIPALLNISLITEKDTSYRFEGSARIFRDDEIDLRLDDAKARFPNLTIDELKSNTYAVLIYENLRCGYSHEYAPHESITHIQPSRQKARASYISRQTKKMVSFHLDYLIGLAEHHVNEFSSQVEREPSRWWIDKENVR